MDSPREWCHTRIKAWKEPRGKDKNQTMSRTSCTKNYSGRQRKSKQKNKGGYYQGGGGGEGTVKALGKVSRISCKHCKMSITKANLGPGAKKKKKLKKNQLDKGHNSGGERELGGGKAGDSETKKCFWGEGVQITKFRGVTQINKGGRGGGIQKKQLHIRSSANRGV